MTTTIDLAPGVYTVAEIAALFRVAPGTIREQIRRGEPPFDGTIRVTRMGRCIRISKADTDRYLGGQPAPA